MLVRKYHSGTYYHGIDYLWYIFSGYNISGIEKMVKSQAICVVINSPIKHL